MAMTAAVAAAGEGALALPAPAKLNLSLRVRGRRADGMHELEGEMVLIDFADTVHLAPRADGKIVRDWQHAEVRAEDDLAHRAACRLQAAAGGAGSAGGATVRIEKRIPVGGGLGGGSSNAASVLMGLNRLWQLHWDARRLLPFAAELGADVPFFFHGKPAIARGIGDEFSPAKIDINSYLLVFPPIVVNTAKVYQEYARLAKTQKQGRMTHPQHPSGNDLTTAAVNLYPPIMQAAQVLRDIAGDARLSGSGGTVFAAFPDIAQARAAQLRLPPATRSAVAAALPRHPLQ